jgi:hypothetical protein
MTDGFASMGASEACPQSNAVTSLVLRAWVEPGTAPQLRTRVVEVGPGRAERPVVVTTSVDEACRVVRSWLEMHERSVSNGGDDVVTHPE